mmetsp:Transcript_6942/g.17026  ORF Transcript_6942/g.17026 Transcript_6942/m.17026 type:complete len:142 (+) Transcript_6942:320-745(+)
MSLGRKLSKSCGLTGQSRQVVMSTTTISTKGCTNAEAAEVNSLDHQINTTLALGGQAFSTISLEQWSRGQIPVFPWCGLKFSVQTATDILVMSSLMDRNQRIFGTAATVVHYSSSLLHISRGTVAWEIFYARQIKCSAAAC